MFLVARTSLSFVFYLCEFLLYVLSILAKMTFVNTIFKFFSNYFKFLHFSIRYLSLRFFPLVFSAISCVATYNLLHNLSFELLAKICSASSIYATIMA